MPKIGILTRTYFVEGQVPDCPWRHMHKINSRPEINIYATSQLAPYLFIICLDCVPWILINLIKGNGFTLKKKKKKARSRYPAETIKDADYADDLALFANTAAQVKSLLHSL